MLSVFLIAHSFIFSGILQAQAAQTQSLAITAISAATPQGEEWIEVYNTTERELDISAWRFVEGFTGSAPNGTRHKLKPYQGGSSVPPYQYAVIAQDAPVFLAKHSGFTKIIFDSSWSSLKEDGERVQLIDADGNAQEDFTYLPAKTGVLKRVNPILADYTSANWKIIEDGAAPGVFNGEDQLQNDQKADSQSQSGAASDDSKTHSKEAEPQAPIMLANAGADRGVLVGEEILFDASGSINTTNSELSYRWDFEDGERASGKTAAHKFAREGDYHVSLIISNGQDEDDDEVVVRVAVNASSENTSSDLSSNQTTEKPKPVARDNPPQQQTDNTTIEGIVLVEPGIFAKTYFYVSDGLASKTLQVYSSSGDFPVLHTGQLIRANGSIGLYQGIRRVRIAAGSDIKILQGENTPDPEAVLLADITDDYRGRFASVEGEVLKEDGNIFLKDTDGNGLLRLEVKTATGIKTAELKEGSRVRITGIIDATRTGLRLLPRYIGDIAVVAPAKANGQPRTSTVKGERTEAPNEPSVQLDFTPVGDTVIAPPRDNDKRAVYKYLITTAVVLAVTLAALIIQEKRRIKAAE